jgi:hypothetical protein
MDTIGLLKSEQQAIIHGIAKGNFQYLQTLFFKKAIHLQQNQQHVTLKS